MSNKYYGNLILNTLFMTKGSGGSDLEKHAGPYRVALYDTGIADYNVTAYSSVLPATARLVSPNEVNMPPLGSELKAITSVSRDIQDKFVSAGVTYVQMYKDENFGEKAGDLACEVNGHYRIEELESRLICVVSDLYQNAHSQHYLGELSFITGGITATRRYGTALAGLCFVDFVLPESLIKDED